MKRHLLLLFVIIIFLEPSCHIYSKRGLPFGTVKGIKFTEKRRIFNTGLVFDPKGYQLEPSWKLYFIADDSVMVFSPKMKKYYGFHVYFDHDSVFNMVDAWFTLKTISRDSLVFKTLRVENKVILDADEGSNVFLTFYADDYLKSGRTKDVSALGLPGKKDSLFIKNRSIKANLNNDNAFAATKPVVLKSKTSLATVDKVVSVSTPLSKIDPSIDYLYPEYNITIHKAYEEFHYYFSVYVDDKGGMTFQKSQVDYMPEYQKTYTDVIKGIISGYLKAYLEVTPGQTLGIPHTSVIYLSVKGIKDGN